MKNKQKRMRKKEKKKEQQKKHTGLGKQELIFWIQSTPLMADTVGTSN